MWLVGREGGATNAGLAKETGMESSAVSRRYESARKKRGDYCSYARCVGSKRMSNGKKKGENNTRCGNRYLGWAFVEAGNFAARFYPEARRFVDRKKAKSNRALAIKALGHNLARASYYVMRDRVEFDAKRLFG